MGAMHGSLTLFALIIASEALCFCATAEVRFELYTYSFCIEYKMSKRTSTTK